MHPAPYIIVGFEIAAGAPDADGIIHDIQTQMPRASTLIPLMTNVGAVSITGDMHDCLTSITDFFVNMNQAHDDVIRWFAQLCDQAWIGWEP